MAQLKDPVTGSRFAIVVDGSEIASFSELQGISTEIEVVEYMKSSESGVTLTQRAGKAKPTQLIFRTGTDSSGAMWAWHELARGGGLDDARKAFSLVIYLPDGRPVARYHLEHAWPSKIEIRGLKAGSRDVLIQTVNIVCQSIQRVAI